jgi:hypothetical protein
MYNAKQPIPHLQLQPRNIQGPNFETVFSRLRPALATNWQRAFLRSTHITVPVLPLYADHPMVVKWHAVHSVAITLIRQLLVCMGDTASAGCVSFPTISKHRSMTRGCRYCSEGA